VPQEVPSSSESESESDGEDAERERELERALADVPFGELQRARADGSLARATSAAKAAAEKKARRASKKRFGGAQLLLPFHGFCCSLWLLFLMGSRVFSTGRWR
jgi:hypothetical protein